MGKYILFLLTFAALLAAILAACSLPAPATPTGEDPAVVYTAAAQTIMAQITQVTGLTPGAPGTASTTPPPATLPAAATETAPGSEPTAEPATASPTGPPNEQPTSAATGTEPAPSPTAEATDTQPAAPSATPLPSDPRASLGEPDFRDTFESAENWPLYEDSHVSFDLDDGELVMTAFNPDFWDSWMLSWPVLEDSYLEMTASQESCSGLDRYGMMLRATKTDRGYIGYLFGVSCDGRYSLRSWSGDKFTIIVDWTASDHLNSGSDQTNRVGVLADGRNLSFYANGNLLKEISDETHQEGRFGLFVGSVNTPDFTVRVDEVSYWEIP
jgi:hypothetical protein